MMNIFAQSFLVATRQEPGYRNRAQKRAEDARTKRWHSDRRSGFRSAPAETRDGR